MATTRITPLRRGERRITVRVYANAPGLDVHREFELSDMLSDPIFMWGMIRTDIDEWLAEVCPPDEEVTLA